MKLIYEEKVSAEFKAKVIEICNELGFDPNWLMLVMNKESGLNHKKTNSIGATGLIQFMPKTARGLGTSATALKSMTAIKQLDYVKKFYSQKEFKNIIKKVKSYVDLHLFTFFPIAVGRNGDFVLKSRKLSAAKVAKSNKIFDKNKDNKLTKAEVEEVLINNIPFEWSAYFKGTGAAPETYNNVVSSPAIVEGDFFSKNKTPIIISGILIVLVAVGVSLNKNKAKPTKPKPKTLNK